MATKYWVAGSGNWHESSTNREVIDDTRAVATSHQSGYYIPYKTFSTLTSLIDSYQGNQWLGADATNQRLHADLISAYVVEKIYYENGHSAGINTDVGVRDFTFWGSNNATAFSTVTYATDTNWTQLATFNPVDFSSKTTFDEHCPFNYPDPKYLLVQNSTAYRYYAFKFANNWGNSLYMGPRKIYLYTISDEHWATSSGGTASFFNKPTAFDDVVFDSASSNANYQCTLNQLTVLETIACNNLSISNPSSGQVTITGSDLQKIDLEGIYSGTGTFVFDTARLRYRPKMKSISSISNISSIKFS